MNLRRRDPPEVAAQWYTVGRKLRCVSSTLTVDPMTSHGIRSNMGQHSHVTTAPEEFPSTSEEEQHSEDAASHDSPAPSTSADAFISVGHHSALESWSQAAE
ncbi:uncharacterized protein [Heterodontus francisci]|uniref:uncharacterized protein isoform X3 n=1 Tax=Heterodontus francisci TaxID=7792 RepID=UPI00355AFDB0